MIGVDLIGDIRLAYFEEQLPIKEIVRRLSGFRASARKVVRGQATILSMIVGCNRRRSLGHGWLF
jgi:hypothetical protein